MKIAKAVILASALAVSAFSLSGCSQTAYSQTSNASNSLNAKVGERCFVTFATKADDIDVKFGTIKSVDNSWVVIDDDSEFRSDGTGVMKQYYIATSAVRKVEFNTTKK